ncbi:MAG: hypothetical protein EPN70_15635 [Paraburkholderia sp.]|uniref:hypothetical protein n=1 Tax=Paraburkholderia sp. TaxID=1926495 RepID=UPI001215404A|nr:hypothetical protein [Paraburkholderia sp.]TAM02951.1 MAG: hypothetical protein EPN70_15635 [Paraburkholderia sp.]TAM29329.1 MAG: hypothetical protein EPN59_12675 [Paraburkholderia sp.]
MDFVSLALFSASVLGLGAAATVLIAKWLPKSAVETAAEHGRFAGLGEALVAKQPAYRPQFRKEAMNVVRTSN